MNGIGLLLIIFTYLLYELNEMPAEKLKFISQLIEVGVFKYLVLIFISCWAGFVRWLIAIKNGQQPKFVDFIIDINISAFVGAITLFICQYYQLEFWLTGAIVGISAHNGTRSLYLISKILKNRFAVKLKED